MKLKKIYEDIAIDSYGVLYVYIGSIVNNEKKVKVKIEIFSSNEVMGSYACSYVWNEDNTSWCEVSRIAQQRMSTVPFMASKGLDSITESNFLEDKRDLIGISCKIIF